MKKLVREISFETDHSISFVDVTDRVKKLFDESEVRDGIVTVYTQHTTAALRINERCDRLQRDMIQFLERTVPASAYLHDEDTVDDRPNARGHLMSLLMGASETIPVSDGELMLGVWQSIFFVELDGPRERRKVIVEIVGE
jgi:secondary thiamine-phosphate synthase enzyme